MESKRKSMTGRIVADKMDKTVIVAIETSRRHPIYHKTLKRLKKYKAHDEKNEYRVGDVVRIVETRPLSREKRWRVVEVITRGEVAEIKPQEIN